MTITQGPPTLAGLIPLVLSSPSFAPIGIGSPSLTADEAAIVASINSIIAVLGAPTNIYGSGVDGTVLLDGAQAVPFASRVGSVYTMTRDTFLSSAQVNAGITLETAGFKLFVASLLVNNGIVSCDGKPAALGVAGGSSALGTMGIGTAGGNGRSNLTGLAGTNQIAANTLQDATLTGGAGGAGGVNAGGAGGTYVPSVANGGANFLTAGLLGVQFTQTTGGNFAVVSPIGGGAGGGGGGSDNGGVTGGGGGGGAGVMVLAVYNLVNNGIIRAKGGDGAAASGGGGNGGGGGGGAGGVIQSTSRFRSGTGVIIAPGGAGGAPVAAGVAGLPGATGHINLFAA